VIIPDNLIKKIHAGEAAFHTAVLGAAPTNVIRVPDNKYIVIVTFTSFHFLDQASSGDIPGSFLNRVYQIEFQSNKSQNHFVLRSDLRIDIAAGAETAIATGSTTFNTYLVHLDDVNVIVIKENPFPWTTSLGDIPPGLSGQPPPLGTEAGVKGAFPVILDIEYAGALAVSNPLTSKFHTKVGGPGNQYNGLRFSVTATSKFSGLGFPNVNNSGPGSYPIINVGYVLVNKNPGDKVQGSSS